MQRIPRGAPSPLNADLPLPGMTGSYMRPRSCLDSHSEFITSRLRCYCLLWPPSFTELKDLDFSPAKDYCTQHLFHLLLLSPSIVTCRWRRQRGRYLTGEIRALCRRYGGTLREGHISYSFLSPLRLPVSSSGSSPIFS